VSGRPDDWGTPQAFFDLLNAEFAFNLDPCASEDNAKAAYIDKETDGLSVDWGKVSAFVNFPYSKAMAWAQKCVEEARKGATVVVLCAARTDTAWWHLLVEHADEVRFVKGRLKFVPPDGGEASTAGFPSCVIVLQPKLKHKANLAHELPLMTLWDVGAENRR
jgi:phage N-6-adenine-methyltransferase